MNTLFLFKKTVQNMLALTNKSPYRKEMSQFLALSKTFIAACLMALLNWLLPVKVFIAVTLLMVMFDLGTGIQAAINRKEVIHSKGLRRTVTKFLMYVAAIVGAHAVQTVYLPSFPMVFTISAYISVTEFWSILENVGVVTGTNVLEAVRSKLSEIINIKKN